MTEPKHETVTPRVSIVIPIYNEEAILHAAVVDLIDRLGVFDQMADQLTQSDGSRNSRHTTRDNRQQALLQQARA